MRVPAKYSNLLFSVLLSVIMVTVVSGTVLLVNQGMTHELLRQWMRSFATAWPVAFPSLLVITPRVRRIVAFLTEPAVVLQKSQGRAQ